MDAYGRRSCQNGHSVATRDFLREWAACTAVKWADHMGSLRIARKRTEGASKRYGTGDRLTVKIVVIKAPEGPQIAVQAAMKARIINA